MLDARKSAILRKVVSEHIATAQPVGSAHVVLDPTIDVSPATVRSDMAALERDGYLTHPHTSAGRVPTDKGYRFFVDQLTAPSLDPTSQEQVLDFFGRAHVELEAMLRDTSRLLSQLTDYAAVVVPPTHDTLTIRSAVLVRIAPRVGLIVLVLSNGAVEKHTVELDESWSDEQIEQATARLGEALVGRTVGGAARQDGRTVAQEADPAGGRQTAERAVLEAILAACGEALASYQTPAESPGEVYVGGTARMADQFPAVRTVREILSILEESFVVVSLLHDVLAQSQGVAIGAEHGVASLAECSLVVAPYEVDDEVVGTIGVLGPTRMNYPQALAAVAVVSQHLSRQLTAGG
ncbi:MAG TPA: heat-inducible transcriptional repressor HrcA [Acidimicrobiales bacterium]|nr:heat-inducible transcriptional repressor HrcA [Acidimicrobiales bacterium]